MKEKAGSREATDAKPSTAGRSLRDQRALAFPDEPFSAYCKVCWQNVYCLWIDKNDHHGGNCINGATRIEDCEQAITWERSMARIRKALAESRPHSSDQAHDGGSRNEAARPAASVRNEGARE